MPRMGKTSRSAPTIQVVDDDASTRRALGRLLVALGFEVSVFESAEAFLESGIRAANSCLLVDIHMPGINGIELCDRLAASGWNPPTILMSAHTDPGTAALASQAKAITMLLKPFDEEALLDAIELAMEPARS
jgi:FixJ family two-component response regulator